MTNCNICLKNKNTNSCNNCTFNSCKKCITNWYKTSNKFKCPQCKNDRTFDNIKYDNIISRNEEELEEEQGYEDYSLLLQEGKQFTPEDFIQQVWEPLPQYIKQEWKYKPIKMIIDDNMEIVAYTVYKRETDTTDAYIYTGGDIPIEYLKILEKDDLTEEDIEKLKQYQII